MSQPYVLLINGSEVDISKQPSDFSGMDVMEIELDDANVKVAKLNGSSSNYFIYINVNYGNTLLDFAGAKDFRVFFYDDGELKSRHWALNNENGFMLQTRYKRIFLVEY
jgi:hypothetical protein